MGSGPPFFLVPGGPFYALVRRLGLAKGDDRDVRRLSFAFGVLPWLAMALIAVVERLASGSWPMLVQAPSTHVRLLVAIPAFFLAERSLHFRTRRCVERIEGFVDPTDERFARALERARALRDALGPELLLLALVASGAVLTVSGVEWLRLGVKETVGPERTASTLWYGVVAMPVFQFLGLRWLWHWTLWSVLLYRMSRLRLRPIATHPDRRGGLGFLGEPPVGFAYVLFGLSSVLAASYALGFHAEAFDFTAFGARLTSLVLVGMLISFGPLLFFIGPLFRARFEGLRAYDELASDYTSRFQRRWIEGTDREELLGTSDIQSLADLANSCDVVRQMRLVPATIEAVVLVVGAVMAPFFLLLMAKIPLSTLFQDFASSFLGQRLF